MLGFLRQPNLQEELLASENGNFNSSIFNGMGAFQESSIWESSVTKEGTFVPSTSIVGSSHVRSSQIDTSHISSTEVGFHQLGTDQFGSFKSGITQIRTEEAGSSQISASKITSNHFGTTEVTATHIIGTEVSTAQISLSQDNSIDSLSNRIILFPTSSSTQVGISKFDSKEISLPSSISSEKFISSDFSHLNTPNLLTSIYSTAQSIWHIINTTIDLNFAITNLPSGQLAEATITGYDSNGRPNAGTLTLDTDGNSLGWFIDSTPDDNTEFDLSVV
jgi:large repetitive protein